MKIDVYSYSTDNNLSGLIAQELKDKHEVADHDCLCRYSKHVDEMIQDGEIADVFILHPHNSNKNGCYKSIMDFIHKCPNSQFYILAYHDDERTEPKIMGIGKFSNVIYITENNARETIQKLFAL